MNIFRKILCCFGFHNWVNIETPSIEWTLPDDQELFEVKSKCSRCNKEAAIYKLIIKMI
jgi:hypothetical protein